MAETAKDELHDLINRLDDDQASKLLEALRDYDLEILADESEDVNSAEWNEACNNILEQYDEALAELARR